MLVFGVIKLEVNHLMPVLLYGFGKRTHGREDCQYFLCMMQNVLRFRLNLHHNISNIFAGFIKPRMIDV